MTRPRVVVVGLGAAGSATAYHLALRGVDVVGFDRYSPPHENGSSHGESRIIREAYFEDPRYVPLVQRAYELWRGLEAESGRSLLRTTGALMVGPAAGQLVSGALRSVRAHRLPHEVLEAADVRRRFPAFRPAPSEVGVYEERGGILSPEECIRAHLAGAAARGAEIRLNEPVVSWVEAEGHVEVRTDAGAATADALVCAMGPWLPARFPALPLVVERQVMAWFRPRGRAEVFGPGEMPVFIWEMSAGELYYGFPDLGQGVKAARHHGGRTATEPSQLSHDVRAADLDPIRNFLHARLPAADHELARTAVCRYTNTPTGHFLIDRAPGHARTWLVSPCSGHGFKFAPAIGEAVADLVLGGSPRNDLSLFSGCELGAG